MTAGIDGCLDGSLSTWRSHSCSVSAVRQARVHFCNTGSEWPGAPSSSVQPCMLAMQSPITTANRVGRLVRATSNIHSNKCCFWLQVEQGSDLFISVWNLHRSPALWDRPNDFVPDRFPVDGPTPTEVTHNFAYLPFGGGRRKCIGAHLALAADGCCDLRSSV